MADCIISCIAVSVSLDKLLVLLLFGFEGKIYDTTVFAVSQYDMPAMLTHLGLIGVSVMSLIVDATVISTVSQDLYFLLESNVLPCCLFFVPLIVYILVGVEKSLYGVCILAGIFSCIYSRITSTDSPISLYLSLSIDRWHLLRFAVLIYRDQLLIFRLNYTADPRAHLALKRFR